MNQIKNKSEVFKKSIRRDSLQNYFKAKRQILIQESQEQKTQKEKFLVQILEQIKGNNDIDIRQNLIILINILALKDPFQKFWRQSFDPTQEQLDQFNEQLIKILLTETLPSFNQSEQMRIYCLNAISNLLADKYCSKAQNINFIIDVINSVYGSMSDWGYNKEMIQLSYVICHLFEQKLVLNVNENTLYKLMQWSEQVLIYSHNQCVGLITKGLHQFYRQVDQIYNSKKNYYFTQHFQNCRIVLVQKCIKKINVDLTVSSLQAVLHFLQANLQYCGLVLCSQEKLAISMLQNIIKFFGQTSQKAQNSCGFFLRKYFTYLQYPQNSNKNQKKDEASLQEENLTLKIHRINNLIEQSKIYLIKKHFSSILQLICWQNFSTKILLLKIIYQLMHYPQECEGKVVYIPKNNQFQLFQFLIKQNLQKVLVNLIQQIDHNELYQQILDICALLIKVGNGKFGLKLVKKMQEIIEQKNNGTALDQKILNFVNFHQHFLSNQ